MHQVTDWPMSGSFAVRFFSPGACDQRPPGADDRWPMSSVSTGPDSRTANPELPAASGRSRDPVGETGLCTGVGATARPLPEVPGLHFGGCGCVSGPALVLALPCSSHPLALTQRWSHSHRPARRVAKRRTAARSDRVHVRSSGQPWVTNGQMKWTLELMDRSESS